MSIYSSKSLARRRAFTLVELLVVIGIIALLVSILLPALNKAKESANAVKCMAQQRQIMTAVMMYTNEQKGCFPLPPSIAEYYSATATGDLRSLMYYMSNSAPSGAGVIRYDCGTLWPYILPGVNKAAPSASTEVSYNKTLYKVMNCPSDDLDSFRPVYWGDLQDAASAKRNFSYSWNSHMRLAQDNNTDVARKISQVKSASHKILLIEELAPNDGQAWIMLNDADDEPAFRHNGRAAYGFADGHVALLDPKELGFKKVAGLNHTQIVDMARCRYYFKLTKEQ